MTNSYKRLIGRFMTLQRLPQSAVLVALSALSFYILIGLLFLSLLIGLGSGPLPVAAGFVPFALIATAIFFFVSYIGLVLNKVWGFELFFITFVIVLVELIFFLAIDAKDTWIMLAGGGFFNPF